MPDNPITVLTLIALLILAARELARYRAEHQASLDKKDLIPVQKDAEDTQARNDQFRSAFGVIASLTESNEKLNSRFDRFLDIAAAQTSSLESNTTSVTRNTQSLESLSSTVTTIITETTRQLEGTSIASVEAIGIRIDQAALSTQRLFEEKVDPMQLQLEQSLTEMQTVQFTLTDLQDKLDTVLRRLDGMDIQDRRATEVLSEVLAMSQQASVKIDSLMSRGSLTQG